MPSIIVPARNNPESTAKCLGSLLLSVNRLQLKCEFVLVDDASAPEEHILDVFRQHRLNAAGHETKIIRSHKHQHYSGVFSIGLDNATRDAIFFISNDMMVTTSFFQALLLVSALSGKHGIVRGTSNYTDSHSEHRVEPPQPLLNGAQVVVCVAMARPRRNGRTIRGPRLRPPTRQRLQQRPEQIQRVRVIGF